ncbi:ATP-binding protein [Bacillus sp. EB01]|uniref:ATP-binding protein n=1 Tax=Bacillus sp. EB01 TaxID=1347086 RepID=UPI0005C7854A|nr:ATP-binding protein [Bacillus sp. EB01]
MIKPQFPIESLIEKPRATRKFTDREKPRDSFWKVINYKTDHLEKYIVLNFYGVGGIGKSRLREELEQIIVNHTEHYHCTLNFETKKFREQGAAMIHLCTELRKTADIEFKNFAMAYAIYWKKLQPLVPINEGSGLSSILEDGDFLAEVISVIEDAPVVGWIGKSLKFASSTWNKYLKDWWNRSGNKIAESLDSKTPTEIEKYLPGFFAQDIKEYIKHSTTTVVIFIDTYEALWEDNRETGSFHKRDEWVRELIANLPEVIWVILGREKLNWEDINKGWKDVLDPHLLDNLSNKDMESFLESCDIKDTNIQTYIMESSLGVPFYLDLAVDIYNEVSPVRELTQDDFPVNDERLRERFLRYLNTNEKETLKMLAVPRYWDLSLFEKLVVEFHTQYPITAYNNLFRFSFINDVSNKPNTWTMHNLMREVLVNELKTESPELLKRANKIVFEYFSNQLMSLEKMDNLELFIESFYFGKRALNSREFDNWQYQIFSRLFPDNDKRIFISRDREMDQLLNFIQREEKVIVNVYGPGGIGKTAFSYKCLDILESNNYITTRFTNFDYSNPKSILIKIAHELSSKYGANFTNFNKLLEANNKNTFPSAKIWGEDFSLWIDQAPRDGSKHDFTANLNEIVDDILSMWISEFNKFAIMQLKLIFLLDDNEFISKEGMEFIKRLIKKLDNVSWILSGRKSVLELEETGLYTSSIELSGFSEMEMKNYFTSLGSLGGGFVLQRIMDCIENLVQTLNIPRTGFLFQLVLEYYFKSIANNGQEPDVNEMRATIDNCIRVRNGRGPVEGIEA